LGTRARNTHPQTPPPEPVERKTLQREVQAFTEHVRARADDSSTPAFEKMLQQIEHYGPKLFAAPLVVSTPQGSAPSNPKEPTISQRGQPQPNPELPADHRGTQMKNFGTGGHGGRRGKNSVLSAFSCSNLLDVSASICVICGQMPFFPNWPRCNR
jgi:hypothetical protein